jgi:hypothetical protein
MKRIVAPIVLTGIAMAALIAGIYVLQSKKTEVTFDDKAPNWQRIPITVHIGDDLEPWRDAFAGAVDIWNGRVGSGRPGCKLFKVVDSVAADIRIRSDNGAACDGPTSDRPGKPATLHLCAHGEGVEIITRRLDDIIEAGYYGIHELGHSVLGFAHDAVGAMSEKPAPVEYPLYLLPNDADVKALRTRYCR